VLHESLYPSPLGPLTLVTREDGTLVELWLSGKAGAQDTLHDSATTAARQLDEYFAGHRRAFDLPIEPKGTDFQRQVWNALLDIPYGETRSYGQIARAIGQPSAVRAVGAANGANPIAIVIPCHRVIGANGTLVGYGGGLDKKTKLLELEGCLSASLFGAESL
jgi:methylated-DNA-[protein]-cysteine S-methyltransferase